MIGIFGGTFDPVHNGHLGLAHTVYEQVGLEQVIFVPLGVPPHRNPPKATPGLRVQMLRSALELIDEFAVDTIEIKKASPSWTIETLEHYANTMPEQGLCLLMGSDAFGTLDTWHHWQSIPRFCHIIFVKRAGDDLALNAIVADFLNMNRVKSADELRVFRTGKVLQIETDIPDISSSAVRQRIASGQSVNEVLPRGVLDIIMQNGLYRNEG